MYRRARGAACSRSLLEERRLRAVACAREGATASACMCARVAVANEKCDLQCCVGAVLGAGAMHCVRGAKKVLLCATRLAGFEDRRRGRAMQHGLLL